MTRTISAPRFFFSGETVEPGVYRDVESGATVTVLEPDTLPLEVRILRVTRFFLRIDQEPNAAVANLTLPVCESGTGS
ncbi:MAG TPA: hypothetical protein VFB38_13610 [Chthonomonadaceae bacterium]|nr:hypothetical protein [Chthonomonadaceae bacterium]